jgi:hypothetical protein
MMGSIVLKPYLGIQSQDRDLIIILCCINLSFSFYYLWNALRLERIFKLENENVVKFGKKLGIVTLVYIPIIFLSAILFTRNLHNLIVLMISLIFLMQVLLIGLVLKEVYDLVFLEESRRDFEINAERKKYIEREKKPIIREDI